MKLKLTKSRKIVSWNYSFLITLPHKWLDYHGLSKGDFVEFELDNNSNLVISPLKRSKDD
ncbi:MAG: AbrB/MazE/SpoVT family DNA-binding domain-containing protein [Nanoarchaeota archaeon]